jgi:hypothetical protein
VTSALLDDHLLRDLLADDRSRSLSTLLRRHEPATTNLYLHRLCRSVLSAPGGALTGAWAPEQRQELGRRLVSLPDEVRVVPMRDLVFRMAEIVNGHRVSTLGAEAIAAAETLGGPLCVWEGDDGPGIRSAAAALGVSYRTLPR